MNIIKIYLRFKSITAEILKTFFNKKKKLPVRILTKSKLN